MAQWKPEKTDVLDALAAEILHNYGRGRVIVAVDGVDGADQARRFAEDLAHAFGRAERPARVIPYGDFPGPAALAADSVTIVEGSGLLESLVIGNWNFAIRLTSAADTGVVARIARAAANAIIDNSDADHPRRVFADSC
jgi:uridine kinase